MKKSRNNLLITILIGFFLLIFRFLMGLSKFSSHDELQIYLIGLKSHLTGVFPYFGPDVVYSKSQIPGGLQGLLIAEPFSWFEIPEAPYILLNILSFLALLFFSKFICFRFPKLPKWLVYLWILTAPWSLHYSTHIENPSYLLIGAILFFVSVIELGKFYKKPFLRPHLAFFFLGFSLFWIMQLHLSWVLTLPYLVWIFWLHRTKLKVFFKGFCFFVLGSTISLSTLIPTLLFSQEHLLSSSGGVENNLVFNPENCAKFPTLILRFFSFSSYEITRFLGSNTDSRIEFLTEHLWLIPFVIVLLIISFFQIGYFIYSFFKPNTSPSWTKVRWFVGLSLVLTGVSFLFSITEPRSHTFYLLYPIALWYSFYCYQNVNSEKLKKVAIVVLVSGFFFQLALFSSRFDTRSLFNKRTLVNQAISTSDYTIIGLRRESELMKAHKIIKWKADKNSFFTDFEPNLVYFKAQNLIKSPEPNPDYICKVDSIQIYSQTFKCLLNTEHCKQIRVQALAKANHFSDFNLVCHSKVKEQSKWTVKTLEASKQISTNWQNLELFLNFPTEHRNDSTEISIYFTMPKPSEAVLFLDDFSIQFQ